MSIKWFHTHVHYNLEVCMKGREHDICVTPFRKPVIVLVKSKLHPLLHSDRGRRIKLSHTRHSKLFVLLNEVTVTNYENLTKETSNTSFYDTQLSSQKTGKSSVHTYLITTLFHLMSMKISKKLYSLVWLILFI